MAGGSKVDPVGDLTAARVGVAPDVVVLAPSAPAGSSLALPATGREVAQFVALRAAECVGADYSNLALLNPEGSSLRLFHSPFLDSRAGGPLHRRSA